MIGLVVLLFISWALLKWLVQEPITVLGILPTKTRLLECVLGIVIMGCFAAINFVWQAHFKNIHYQINPSYDWLALLDASYWLFKSVAFEELVFRGAILYLLIQRIGSIKACILSAIAFGIYHWFSYGLFGAHLVLMIYIFLLTASGGWMFAFAFAKTKSIYAPLGLHFGWNFVTAVVFSSGAIGNQWLVPQGEAIEFNNLLTLLFFSLQAIIIPCLVTWLIAWRYKNSDVNHAQVNKA
ncbi:CPBP family intramembrane glutamic endopeptidase [Thalassotalea marina]|uniref:CAAX prenyl protease 2/Lysostaphin resistance protein A-like domain-containing protein n=1 Tax=Thalassotalea marina TaxID=1673741 RepID=A0A919ELX3_9GAMM|nr:type II CAAX endopeptidase family protein [Thalassotalea marina]GHF98049.1 hypothetical protein GCM10017161_28070 [Thalassotalea marina]